MRSDRHLAAIAISLLLCTRAFSDGLVSPEELAHVEFSPVSYVPGDVVTAYLRLQPGAGSWKEETITSGFPEPEPFGVRVLSVALEERSGDPLLLIRFVPWQAGPGLLPELVLGSIEIPRIRFECGSSLLAGGTEPPVFQPQLDPPGLYARLYVTGGVLLVLVLAGIVIVTKVRPWWRSLLASRAFARARREFDALLDEIARTGKGAAAWAALSSGLRSFVGFRVGTDWSALTSGEVAALPSDSAAGLVAQESAVLLSIGDQARFAGATDLDLCSGVEAARKIARKLDVALDPRSSGSVAPC